MEHAALFVTPPDRGAGLTQRPPYRVNEGHPNSPLGRGNR